MADIDPDLQENENAEKEPRLYELGYHLLPALSEEEMPQEVGNIKDMIETRKGSVVSEQMPRPMSLAYSISKVIQRKRKYFDTALFGWIKFHMSPRGVLELHKELKHNKNVLRFILIKTSLEKPVSPKKMTFLKPRRGAVSVSKERVVRKPEKKLSEEELEKAVEELIE